MNLKTSRKKIIKDSDIVGPMMIYKPITENEQKELAEWVAKSKSKQLLKTRNPKSKVLG